MRVWNLRDKNLPAGVVKVDRGTDWGNPFVMKDESHRDWACDMYELYAEWRLKLDPNWLDALEGQDLACWCAPKRCHAETLIELAKTTEDS